jgi:glycosyltransferase involved in cell wall biosynthesis
MPTTNHKESSNSRRTGARRHCMIVHNRYPEREPRVERQALGLTEAGIDVDVICLRQPGEESYEVVNGVHVYRLPSRHSRGANPLRQLYEYLEFFVLAFLKLNQLHWRAPYHAVQIHNLPDFLVFVALVQKVRGVPVILDLHDLMPEFYAERFQQRETSWLVKLVVWQERISCWFAHHVITVTELWRQTLIERGVRPDKVSVVMNVADEQIFHRVASEPAHYTGNGNTGNGNTGNGNTGNGNTGSGNTGNGNTGSGNGAAPPFTLFYHGTVAYRYGLDILIRALDQVRRSAPQVRLILHGAGEFHPAVVALVEELGLQAHVVFSIKALATDELPALIQQADLAVIPYRQGIFTSGILPTKMMEYAALGVPAVAARTPAIVAYFDKSMVRFFTPGNSEDLAHAILALYNDRDALQSLAHNISLFNQRHSWQQEKQHYVQLVHQLTAA